MKTTYERLADIYAKDWVIQTNDEKVLQADINRIIEERNSKKINQYLGLIFKQKKV